MTPDSISEFAAELGIEDGQLIRFHRDCVRKHKDGADEWLLAWMQEAWQGLRPKAWLLSAQGSSYIIDKEHLTPDGDERHYGYTETPHQALDCGEAPPPDEIASYRRSREARDNYQAEQMDEVGNLMSAMEEVRASLDALPAERKQSMSRAIWTFKGRMDALEREIRRRLAA